MGVSPQHEPIEPREGWYTFTSPDRATVSSVLEQFGLTPAGLTVLVNGNHANGDHMIAGEADVHVFLKSLGG